MVWGKELIRGNFFVWKNVVRAPQAQHGHLFDIRHDVSATMSPSKKSTFIVHADSDEVMKPKSFPVAQQDNPSVPGPAKYT